MFLPTNEEWLKWGITTPAHKFFVERWHELFDEDTFDSWQVQMSSLQTILDELTEVVSVIAHTPVSHHNFQVLVAEANAVAAKDPVIRNHFSFARSLLKELEQEYDKGVKDGKRHNLEQAQRKIAVIKGHLAGYDFQLKSEILSSVKDAPTGKNHELCHLLMILGTNLLTKGYSVPSLRDSLVGILDPPRGDFFRRVELLIDEHDGKAIKYECRFLVRWPKPLPKFDSVRAAITDVRSQAPDDKEAEFLKQDESASILCVRVEAQDPHSARARAEEELCSLLSLNRLYQPQKGADWKASHTALVRSDDGSQIQIVPTDVSRLTYVHNANKPAQVTAEALRLIEQLHESQRDVLLSSLMYHRLFTEALADEARLVNLWIALEILIPTGSGSTIDRTCDYISSMLTTEYPVVVAKALPVAMRMFWRTTDKSTLMPQLTWSNGFKFEVYDVLKCMTDQNDGKLITELLSLVGEHPVLTHKVYHLWKTMFCAPDTMRSRLEEHKQKIDWQIRRIYRARNFVMHRGRSVPGMRQLIQHLHSYYIMMVHTIIHDLRNRPEWGIAEACESRKSLYANALRRLNEHENNPVTIEDILYLFTPRTGDNTKIWTHHKQ